MRRAMDGGCACGSVRYRVAGPPIVVHGCHCRHCQRITGSAFAINMMIEADRVTLLAGSPAVVSTPSARPEGQKIHRCPRCHVAVWNNHGALGDGIVFVFAGTLDEAEQIAPDVHCFTATKHPWVRLPEDARAFEGDYDADEVWSDEAKARVGAAMRA